MCLAQRRRETRLALIHQSEASVIRVQAQARGVIARLRLDMLRNALDTSIGSIGTLQAICRGQLARQRLRAVRATMSDQAIRASVTSLQSICRGRLHRSHGAQQRAFLETHVASFAALQNHLRGVLARRKRTALVKKVDDAASYIVAIQATARGLLVRRRKGAILETAATAKAGITGLQAIARARLAKQAHQTMHKALAKVEVAGSVGGLQAFLRSKLAKHKTTEQKKKLEFVQPDVISFQAVARGYLARLEYREWRDYLADPHTQGALVFLQSLTRGFLARRRLWHRVSYIHRNVDKVIKVQALWRGRKQRLMFDKLMSGVDVDVATIQNYMHLLDDTEGDFRDQMRTDTLRQEVVGLVRTNQILETEVIELDTKIALIVNNKMTFEELVRAKRRNAAGEEVYHQPSNDPFSSSHHLDRTTTRKLELFEHLFFTIQTRPEYLARLIRCLSRDEDEERDFRAVEAVISVLFGYERREEYLFHKLLQVGPSILGEVIDLNGSCRCMRRYSGRVT